MPTPTANYSFNLPTPGGDDDAWGVLLNANWAALDTQLFSGTIGADTTGNAATATTAAAATLAADTTKLATARDFTIGATARSFDGSANVTWSLSDIGVVLADQAEAQAGTDNAKFMTPLRTAEAIAALTQPVPALTQTQAEDANSTVFGTVSGQRLAQSFDAREQQFGVGQTWQTVSRSAGTVYQNTTGRPIFLSIGAPSGGGGNVEVSANGFTNWLTVAFIVRVGNDDLRPAFVPVPDGIYYRLTGGTPSFWVELR